MVIDDDASILEIMKIILEENNYEPILIPDGNSLLAKISAYAPDIIFLDIWLSGFNGTDLIKEIHGSSRLKNIPVLFLSANNNVAAVARENGATDYLSKPFDINDLILKLQKYLV